MRHPKIAACDDSLKDREMLAECIRENLPRAEITVYESGEKLVRDMEVKKRRFQIIFLAVCADEKDGIGTAKEIRRLDANVPLIFAAASDQYYREAFDLYVFQYLLKPVSSEQVKEVLDRLEGLDGEEECRVHFHYRTSIYQIRHSDIRYISSSLHTVSFHLKDGQVLKCRGKMGDFEEQLRDSSLIRCHQSFYVNLESVTGMKGDTFLLGEQAISISRSYLRDAQNRYREYLKKKKAEQ